MLSTSDLGTTNLNDPDKKFPIHKLLREENGHRRLHCVAAYTLSASLNSKRQKKNLSIYN